MSESTFKASIPFVVKCFRFKLRESERERERERERDNVLGLTTQPTFKEPSASG